MNILEEIQSLEKKERKKRLHNMTVEEKLELVDALIDRDASVWKEYNRRTDPNYPEYGPCCDFGYYFQFIDSGFALSERQR